MDIGEQEMKMTGRDTVDIRVINRLITEKRTVSVYHHATKGAHLISHNGSFTFLLQALEAGDYMHLSLIRGPGRLNTKCVLEIPIGLDFEFSGEGKVYVNHKGDGLSVGIPPGPPLWQLKVMWPGIVPDEETMENGGFIILIREVEIMVNT